MAMRYDRLDAYPPLPGDWRQGVEQYAPTAAQLEAAMTWLLKLREQDLASSPAFEAWQAEHPAHGFAAAEAKAVFAAMAKPAKDAVLHYHRPRRYGSKRLPRARRIARTRFAVAASVAILAMLRLTDVTQWARDLGADAVTAAGESKPVTLADGSRITLNSRSALDIDVRADGRQATLRHGEAYFEIAKDPTRPFTITAGEARVSVVGTHFNIRMDREQTFVSVTEGRVRVYPTARPDAAVLLEAGQQALIEHGGAQTQAIDPFEVIAWRRGEILAYKTPLRTVVRELNRYRAPLIYIVNGALADRTVTGLFKIDDSNAAVTTIERTLGVESITLPTGQVILY
jgi:transmembrane sensor